MTSQVLTAAPPPQKGLQSEYIVSFICILHAVMNRDGSARFLVLHLNNSRHVHVLNL